MEIVHLYVNSVPLWGGLAKVVHFCVTLLSTFPYRRELRELDRRRFLATVPTPHFAL